MRFPHSFMSHQRRLPLRLSSTKSMVHSSEAHSRTRPRRSLASRFAASSRTGKRICDNPSVALPHCFPNVPECERTRSRAGVCASAEFSSERSRSRNGSSIRDAGEDRTQEIADSDCPGKIRGGLPSIALVMLRQAVAVGRRKSRPPFSPTEARPRCCAAPRICPRHAPCRRTRGKAFRQRAQTACPRF